MRQAGNWRGPTYPVFDAVFFDRVDDWSRRKFGEPVLAPMDVDEEIAALVEVGAIPYRERYEGRMIG